MKVAIIQSNYIPWKGYFDIINDVDIFIFLDDVQYTNRDWRNRNRIKSSHGVQWLTIPVGSNRNRLINEVEFLDDNWKENHFKTIAHNYKKSTYFKSYEDYLYHIYFEKEWHYLSDFNQYVIKLISEEILNIKTKFIDSRILKATGSKDERLIELIQKVNGKEYISGPAAKSYIQEDNFAKNEIKLLFKDYSGYPEYPQFHQPFNHFVSILDLIFHTGADAPYYIWGWRS